MGLYVQSLENIPLSAHRDYFIYLLDYGWHEPLGEALMNNYEKMAQIAAENKAVVIEVHIEFISRTKFCHGIILMEKIQRKYYPLFLSPIDIHNYSGKVTHRPENQ